jgi:hypothetical protein
MPSSDDERRACHGRATLRLQTLEALQTMANPSRKSDFWIAVAALAVLGAAIWSLVWAAKQVQMELIPPSLTVAPARAGAYVLLCLIVGTLTMALVQMWRTLVPVRGFFQRAALSRFFEESMRDQPPVSYEDGVPWEVALGEFELRAGRPRGKTGLRWNFWGVLSPDLYDLPIEQLCGQLNLAFESGLSAPGKFQHLLHAVLGQEGKDPLATATDFSQYAEYQDEAARNRWLLSQAEARATLSRMAQQRIDGFQIATGGAWRRLLRVCVLGMSVVFSWQATAYRMATAPNAVAVEPEPRFYKYSDSAASDSDGRVGHPTRSGPESKTYDSYPRRPIPESRTDDSYPRRPSPESLTDDSHPTRSGPESKTYDGHSPDDERRGSLGTHLFQSVLMGLIAGYVAMVLRDLVAILELKRRQT